ncbi:MAG: DoxX family membrane protein [Bacteroidales bacterium]|nr:DoxX family membrane protein [Bacteroidales bacterium]
MKNTEKITTWLLTILRIVIGWHFLYEGLAKLANPNWSAALYLMESKWLFSGFFHWLIGNNATLQIVNFMNIWGLIIIGFCLFVGLFTRFASIAGALLLLLYYVANPPFVISTMPSQSHFYILNYNLIEAVVLIVLASFRKEAFWGVQRLLSFTTLKGRMLNFLQKTIMKYSNHMIPPGGNL